MRIVSSIISKKSMQMVGPFTLLGFTGTPTLQSASMRSTNHAQVRVLAGPAVWKSSRYLTNHSIS